MTGKHCRGTKLCLTSEIQQDLFLPFKTKTMTSAIMCIIILACTVTLTSSAGPIKKCRCSNTPKGVRVPLKDFVSAAEYPPRPYCTRKEVIITLTNGRSVCLNPTERYTKALLNWAKKRDAAKNTTAPETATVSETETATVSETVP